VSRKAVRLTLDHLPELPEPARTSLRWKLDAVARAEVEPEQVTEEVESWLSWVLREWGSCGRVVVWDDEPVGMALYAPPAFLPGLAELPTAPPSPDAVVLAELYVAEHARGAGVGRMLVQATARDLVLREVPALEAFGVRGNPSGTEGADLLPVDFLGAVGFKTHRAHGATPRLRMELRATRTWMNEFELALERLVGAVRPGLKPQAVKPQGRVPRNDLRREARRAP